MDRLLPLPERYAIPAATVAAIARARARGGRVIAAGTTVLRALEGCVRAHGELRPGEGITDLVIDHATTLTQVDGILTGMHAPGESHRRLLEALVAPAHLEAAWVHAVAAGYLAHELGDVTRIADLEGVAGHAAAAA
ncbi:MAG: S-adenosylmethionine:tRNA ribosyltransferase-isomerase [Myxococcales bacterium]|nr:S-adenosylmethionine:tRNA ribosyltransferase-isomerase [Myxococcales bacterium]